MKNIISEYGLNAGKVLNELENNGPLSRNILMKKTRLTNEEISGAIGWLARENKISKDGSIYRIGETNLVEKIGKDAGKVWDVLNRWKEVDLSYISKLASINKLDMYSAIGWLAKEGKLKAKLVKPKALQIKFKLVENP
jgi:hypothetical protein